LSDPAAWSQLKNHLTETATLRSVAAMLAWDQQTNMPAAAAPHRGSQMAAMSKLIHERATDVRIGQWLTSLESADDLNEVQQGGVRNTRRGYDRSTKLSSDLVQRIAKAEAAGFGAWVEAKKNNDYDSFAPFLQTILDLTREKAAAIDPDRHPYDVLLEDFDPGMTVEQLRPIFARLRDGLVQLIEAVKSVEQLPELSEQFDVETQEALHMKLLPSLGYDLNSGRLDAAEHPFTIGISPGDVRITTHLYPDDFLSGLGGTVHEAGHGMYEQGIPVEFVGTGVGDAASLGLHESQSRFWENFISRSQAFFNWFETPFREAFPESKVRAADLYRAANRVEPGLIRVAADEVTYNLHIIVRFELELELLEGTLSIADLPAAWNAKYEEYLGISPSDDSNGVLQDVHWCGGAFAYFPSYTLGNLYASSLAAQMQQDIPDLWTQVEAGEFASVLEWLRTRVHHRGHIDDAPDIVRAAVGDRDSVEDLLSYLWARHGALYGVARPA